MVARIVIGAPASGQGKTTIAIGLMAAFRQAGLKVAPFKVGPDYIDPGYHTLAAGRPGRNLDPHLCTPELVAPLFNHGATTPEAADIGVVEGVMGLFDGKIGADGFGSTAHVAELLAAPVILVADASHASATTAAIVHGLATYSSRITVAGVIANRVSSKRVGEELRRALTKTGVLLLGTIPASTEIAAPSRHLGLIPAAERASAQQMVDAAGHIVADNVDLDEILRIGRRAGHMTTDIWRPQDLVTPIAGAPTIAVATGSAFTFRYPETVELLQACGAKVVEFDPLTDPQLPAGTQGLYLGGGFPEVYASQLAENTSLRTQIGQAVRDGLPTVAECAGLLYLCRTIDGIAMAGALDVDAQMTPKLKLGYRESEPESDSLIYRIGEPVRYHEFHRTRISGSDHVYSPTMHASYQHVHWAAYPQFAARLVAAAANYSPSRIKPNRLEPIALGDLRHHGDSATDAGLVDLAVNVLAAKPPKLLADALRADVENWSAYPRFDEARDAIAKRHHIAKEMILPTAGATEAFDLVARTLCPSKPIIIHPQFSEPERALTALGIQVYRAIAKSPDFDLPQIADDFDLVCVGNPTNPTGKLYSANQLRSLRGSNRIVLVDEAFMSALPDDTESLIGSDMAGILVIRSLTKTWSIAGVRAGYLVGDAQLIARCQENQSPWSVSSPAARVMTVTASPQARTLEAALRAKMASHRDVLVAALSQAGFPPITSAATPFVTFEASRLGSRPALRLRENGWAVRDCASFPGLGPNWLRVAVREPEISHNFVQTLVKLTEER